MTFGIAGFEIRYQLRNPVFWVAIAIFFLMGFGITASENVRIGTPGAVHENAPFAIAVATAVFSLFYLFIITAFVANAIVRDDNSGFAPIVRATSVTAHQIVIGRFVGGLIIAWLGYLAIPLGMFFGSLMPWVDPETIGPQKLSYYLWNFAIFALPNIFLMSALLFALATALRSMMAAYVGAIALVMGYLITSSVVGQKIEYREVFARWEPLGTGALDEATRYWTQAEMNSRLLDLSGLMLFNRIWAIVLGLVFLGLALWRFSMTERAPSKRRLRRLAKRQRLEEKIAAAPVQLGGDAIIGRDLKPSVGTQFMTRLRVEIRQVLTSPGLIVLTLLAIAFVGLNLFIGSSAYGTADHPTVAATITIVSGVSPIFLLMIAAFYGGELVWRERDRKVNELINSTAVPSWVITIPKMLAIFVVLLIVNLATAITGIVYQLVEGARVIGVAQYIGWFILPAAIDGLLIAILAVFVQVLSPNKYVGWGILFIWFVGNIFLNNMGYSNPLYVYAREPNVPFSDFVGAGSFWKGAAVFQFYWLCFAVILAVVAHMLWPRGTDLSVRTRAGRMPHVATAPLLAIIGLFAVAMAATGVYGYYNIKVLNRYQTSDDQEKFAADYERKYLKYEKLPQPAITRVTLDAQLFPRKRLLLTDGRYDLVNRTTEPINEIHVRKGSQTVEWLNLQVAGARLIMDDPKFGYQIYRFDKPLAPGATTTLTFKSRLWRRGFPRFKSADRHHRERHVREQWVLCARHRHEPR